MSFHISEEKYNKLLVDMQEVVRENIMDNLAWYHTTLSADYGFGPQHHMGIWIGFESLLKQITDNQMNQCMYELSAEIFDKLDIFMIGLKALQERCVIEYSQEDIVHALNEILDQSLDSTISSRIKVDYPNNE
jgi:hypothetical protein